MSFLNFVTSSAAPSKGQESVPLSDRKNKTEPTPLVVADKVSVPRLHHALAHLGKHGKGQNQTVKVVLVSNSQLASSANTALTTVTSLTPNTAQDFSSFAAVFDLVRVTKVDFHVRLATSGTALNGTASWGVAFDPANAGTYSSVSDVMTAAFKIAPIVILNTTPTAPDFSMTKTGFLEFHGKLESQRVTNDGGATAVVGGGWFGTSDTTAVIGYVKPYVPSLGTGVVSNLEFYTTYHAEFKWRT